jgi:predicted negative regulator of RcsB-dependent stress response
VDQQTKAALKQIDPLVQTTTTGLEWASANRKQVILSSAILLGVIVVAVIAGVVWSQRSQAAANAFGVAIETYQAPVRQPGQPSLPDVKSYGSVAERAKAANELFKQVVDQYGMTKSGKNARYFLGLTYIDEGQTQPAETTLKQVADGWDKPLGALAKLSLAGLYRQTGRDSQAIQIYNDLTAHPTDTVPAGLAQLQLAELYAAEGKGDEARKIYASLKDKDKTAKGKPGVVSEIAGEKLNPAAAASQPQL